MIAKFRSIAPLHRSLGVGTLGDMNSSFHRPTLLTVATLLLSCASPQLQPVDRRPERPPADRSGLARQEGPVLIRDASIWTGTGKVSRGDILLEDGRIVALGNRIDAPAEATVIDARGRIVTPGLVDMHSHLGVYPWPHAKAHADGNEMTGPTMPMVRAVDGFDPEDPAIPRALGGGVTTALILPGSGNIMGGEALHVKLRGKTVAEMQIPGAPRALKMAMGENPKRVYGKKSRTPMSRLGHGWLMRQQFFKARRLMRQQDQWERSGLKHKPRPFDAAIEPLVALLRGDVLLQVHCYEVHDIETLLRVAREFRFRIAAIHHALEAWKVPKILRDNDITVALFSDLWGYKLEAYDASVHAPKTLHAAGVKVAIKSDHPVLDARDLVFEAAKAHHYGLDEQAALAAITRIPAMAIGMAKRIGTLEAGKDADVVLWSQHPFTIGARPAKVWVEGVLVVDAERRRP